MKKKIIYLSLMLIVFLGISSTVFGAKSWSEVEFEKLINLVGYGEIDLDEFDFSPSYDSKSTFVSYLSDSSKGLIILKGNNTNFDGFDSSKFCVYIEDTSSNIVFSSYRDIYSLYSNYNSTVFSSPYIFDINNKTVTKVSVTAANRKHSLAYPYTWQKANCTVSDEEWTSTGYKTLLFQNACIFSDFSIGNTYYTPAGGRIITSSYGDVMYNGNIFYYPSTKLLEFTFNGGFEENVNYDLFIEEYKIDNETGHGINYNTLVTTKINSITKDINSYNINDFVFKKDANYVYRACIGRIDGDNEVYIATDWLVPNDNTFRIYPYFTMSHYYTFMSLVGLDYDYVLPDEDIGDVESGDTGESGDIGGITSEPCFLNAPSGLIETDLGFEVDVISNINLDVSNYYIAFTQYGSDFTPEFSQMIRDNSLWQNKENLQYSINLKDFYDFSGDKYFKVFLIKTSSGIIDSSDYFYTDPTLIIPENSNKNEEYEEEIKGGIAGIFQIITNLPKLIGNAIAGIFIPAEGFFSDYFSELNDWFSERLGILYFPFDFIVDFFSRIYTSEFKDPTIVIPAMQIPLFEEYGNIYDGTTFNFKEFINQHETFMYIYNLYLIAVDGIVIFGLIRLLMKKYEEVTTNGN